MWLRAFFSWIALGLVLACSVPALALDEFDALAFTPKFKIESEVLRLEIKARARLGLHDLQGQGGPKYDSPTDTATIGTRSPFVQLDSFELSFRASWRDLIWLNSNLGFQSHSAALSAIYFEYQDHFGAYRHKIELGYASPIAATPRRSIRYPLQATNYWRYPEYHLAYFGQFELDKTFKIHFASAIALTRPLQLESIHSSPVYRGLFSQIAFGPAVAYSGNSPTGSLLAGLSIYGFDLEVFANLGRIASEAGIYTLIASLPHYRQLPEFKAEDVYAPAYWYGARLRFERWQVHAMVELIHSKEQWLERLAYYAQAGYRLQFEDWTWWQSFEVLVRFEQSFLRHATRLIDSQTALRSTAISNAISWDYDILTLALRAQILRDFIALNIEYAFYFERNAVPALNQANLGIHNNELLVQIEARY